MTGRILFAFFIHIAFGFVSLNEVQQHQVIYHSFELVHNTFDPTKPSGLDRFEVVLALLAPNDQVEFFKGSFINESGRKIHYQKIVGNPLYDLEAQYLASQLQTGRIIPEPITNHRVFIHDWKKHTLQISLLVGMNQFVGQQQLSIETAIMDPLLSPVLVAIRRRAFMKGLERWSDSSRYAVVVHHVRTVDGEIENNFWILDKKTQKTFKQIFDDFGDLKDTDDFDSFKIMDESDSGSLGYTHENGPSWPHYEIARGNIIPEIPGNHTIIFTSPDHRLHVYSPRGVHTYGPNGNIAQDSTVGAAAFFRHRRECFRRFNGLVDPETDEILIHIVGPELTRNKALIRNRITGKFRWLHAKNGLYHVFRKYFFGTPQWETANEDSNIYNSMIENGDIVGIPFHESQFHPVIGVLWNNEGFLVHEIDEPRAKIHRNTAFNPIIHYLYGHLEE